MNKLADMEKEDREERMTFQSTLTSDVRSMLADFSKERREKARIARDERKAFLLEIKNQVTDLRKQTVEPHVTVLKAKAAKPPVKVKAEALKAKAVEPPVAVKVEPPKLEVVETPVAAKVEPPKVEVFEAPVAAKVEAPKVEVVESPVAAKVERPKVKAFESLDTILKHKDEKDLLREKFDKAVAKTKRAKKK